MKIRLGDVQTAGLVGKAMELGRQGRELMAFADRDPELAGDCGVEVNAVEAAAILDGGRIDRLAGLRGTVDVDESDLAALSRLEGTLSRASSRIQQKISALDAAEGQALTTKLGSIIGLATGAVGFIKSLS